MKNKENEHYVKLGITAAIVILFGLIVYFWMLRPENVAGAFNVLIGILMPFLYGAVLAYLVTPLARRLERIMPRTPACLLAVLIAVLIVLAVVVLIVPQLLGNIRDLANKLPLMLDDLNEKLKALFAGHPEWGDLESSLSSLIEKIKEAVKANAGNKLNGSLLNLLLGVAGKAINVLTVLMNLFLGIIVAIYLLMMRTTIGARAVLFLRGCIRPSWADWIDKEVHFADRMFQGFLTGKVLDGAIAGVVTYIVSQICRFESPLLIGVIVGVTNIIPFVGPYLGAIPCTLLLLLQNPLHGVIFLIYIIIFQQIDGNIIGPKLLGDATGLSALGVMFSILFFGGLWGLVGTIIGVPLMCVICDIVRQVIYRITRKHGRGDLIDEYESELNKTKQEKTNRRGKAEG